MEQGEIQTGDMTAFKNNYRYSLGSGSMLQTSFLDIGGAKQRNRNNQKTAKSPPLCHVKQYLFLT